MCWSKINLMIDNLHWEGVWEGIPVSDAFLTLFWHFSDAFSDAFLTLFYAFLNRCFCWLKGHRKLELRKSTLNTEDTFQKKKQVLSFFHPSCIPVLYKFYRFSSQFHPTFKLFPCSFNTNLRNPSNLLSTYKNVRIRENNQRSNPGSPTRMLSMSIVGGCLRSWTRVILIHFLCQLEMASAGEVA